MFNFVELEKRYNTNASFNRVVNLFRNLIEEHGFMPSEMREAMFLAQYKYEFNTVSRIIRTQEEWENLAKVRETAKELLSDEKIKDLLK